jgi:hypothetical protein
MANAYKNADMKRKVAPGGHKPVESETTEKTMDSVVTETPIAPVIEEKAPVEAVAPVAEKVVAPLITEQVTAQPKAEKKAPKVANKIDALLGPAQKAKKQERSTIAVYLSKENQAWLKELANQRGKSVSELLDQILNELRG